MPIWLDQQTSSEALGQMVLLEIVVLVKSSLFHEVYWEFKNEIRETIYW